jgi:hypothetical protein
MMAGSSVHAPSTVSTVGEWVGGEDGGDTDCCACFPSYSPFSFLRPAGQEVLDRFMPLYPPSPCNDTRRVRASSMTTANAARWPNIHVYTRKYNVSLRATQLHVLGY